MALEYYYKVYITEHGSARWRGGCDRHDSANDTDIKDKYEI